MSNPSYFIIERKNKKGDTEHWSQDQSSTRKFFQRTDSDWYDKKYVSQYEKHGNALNELSRVIKPNYCDSFQYSIKNMADPDEQYNLNGEPSSNLKQTKSNTGDSNNENNNTKKTRKVSDKVINENTNLISAQRISDELMEVKDNSKVDLLTQKKEPPRKLSDKVLTDMSGQIRSKVNMELRDQNGEKLTESNEGQPNKVNKIGEGAKKEKDNYLERQNKMVNDHNKAKAEHTLWVVRKTDRKTNKNQYLSAGMSNAFWSWEANGESLKKFSNLREAQIQAHYYTAGTIRTRYEIDTPTFSDVQKAEYKGDWGNYEPENQSKIGVGIKE
jgi:hypothetical protein